MIMLVLLALPVLLGGTAACLANGVATYRIARWTRREPWLWTLLAVAPGANLVSRWFYATTLLRMLDELETLKTDVTFGPNGPGNRA
jgi:hypothetical protein